MDYSTIPGGLRIGSEATAIIQTLRDFGRRRSVPIGLVARSVGRAPEEIRESLKDLESQEIVQLDDTSDSVTLIW